MYVYLQAYQPGRETAEPVYAYVSFYRGPEKAFETAPAAGTESLTSRLKTVPIQFRFPLAGLEPGEYLCQVTVLEPGAGKANFWQAPVMVTP
jgi:hypothetical protein